MLPSPAGRPPFHRDPTLIAGGLLVLLTLVSMGWVVPNGFVQDDYGILLGNQLVRHWDGVWRAFGTSYWPPVGDIRELYRPLSVAWFTPQWIAGNGAPVVFRTMSLLLYVVSVLTVWRLLRLLAPAGAAWVGAAAFAVHPVHVEAIAIGVNQSELIVGTLLAWALIIRIRSNRGEIPERRAGGIILGLFVTAVFTKEHALVLPALLGAADLLLDRDRGTFVARLRAWGWNYAGLVLIAAGFWLVRGQVLGAGTGTIPAEAVQAGMLQRAWTMAGVPAEWLRLYLWPAHLQADWNLLEWVPSRGWTLRETAGLAAIIAFLAGLAAAWQRRPVTAFGLAWMAVALAPVSNVLIPSGIVLAERVLFLSTIGLVIVVADLVGVAESRWERLARPLRLGSLLLMGIFLALGAIRSSLRFAGWYNRPAALAVGVADAPLSWRTLMSFGLFLSEAGDSTASKEYIWRAVSLRPDDPLISKGMIDRVRLSRGECHGAAIAYEAMLHYAPRRSDARASLLACLVHLGRYAEARGVAERGIATGLDTAFFASALRTADSAGQSGARAGTVRLREAPGKATVILDPSRSDTLGAFP